MHGHRSSLLIVFLIVFIDLLGFGIVIPILPYYAQQYGASAWQLGWLMTSYSLAQFLFAPLWGRVSDRYGRRPVLLLSLLGSSISLATLGFAPSLVWLFIARTFAGVFGANISTAYAYVTDVTTDENRAKGMGIIGAGFGLGFIFGPAIGGILSTHGYGVPMFVGAGLAAANCLFGYFKLAEPATTAEARASNRVRRFDPQVIRRAMGSERARIAIALFFLLTMAVTQMEVVFAIYLKQLMGFDARQAGLLLAVTGIVMVSVQGGAIGKLARRFGEPRLVRAGFTLCAVSLGAFAFSTSLPALVASLCVLALGHGILHPSLSSLASKGAAASDRGAVMGVFQSASSLARVLGPIVAGWLYDAWAPNAPFLGGVAILAMGLMLAITALGRPALSR